jgi:hypothetical protein
MIRMAAGLKERCRSLRRISMESKHWTWLRSLPMWLSREESAKALEQKTRSSLTGNQQNFWLEVWQQQ